jgi:hypothetical protein
VSPCYKKIIEFLGQREGGEGASGPAVRVKEGVEEYLKGLTSAGNGSGIQAKLAEAEAARTRRMLERSGS